MTTDNVRAEMRRTNVDCDCDCDCDCILIVMVVMLIMVRLEVFVLFFVGVDGGHDEYGVE